MHEVFISYADGDEKVAEDICNLFEKNGSSCWYKKRDYGENDTVSKISQAIRDSNRVVLVYSENAKDSNFTITEIDIAFSEDLPILVFNIDGTPISPKLQFYLENKPSIDAYPDTEKYYGELLEDSTQLVSITKEDPSKNDVYICYTEEDDLTADAICHVMESNGMKCWFKKRDFKVGESIQKVNNAIKSSKSVVLVYSEDIKKSNFVKTELEIAHSSEIPIVCFKIDEFPADEFKSLKDAHWLEAFPNPGKIFKDLVGDVSKTIGKDVDEPVVSKEYEDLKIDKKPQQKVEETKDEISEDFDEDYGVSKRFKKIAIGVTAVLVVILLVVYLSNYIFLPGLTDDKLVFSDGGVSIENSNSYYENYLDINVSEMKVGSKYSLEGFVEFPPDDFDDYYVTVDYADSSGAVVDSTNTPVKDLTKTNDGKILLVNHDVLPDVTTIYVTIFNAKGVQVYYDVFTDL
ncbi:MAG: toll/interleukin-1 receptor domain-containing protein [Methanobrevibacter sp.]|nr:toll/interleukin-1 receptor domain-containing protein [Methanobrevibacter sp.]MBQ2654787.1 toll/interleukin-1 receptor domain-containing protein [Methanobrevibacter sp.]